jgi:hypothetical protein
MMDVAEKDGQHDFFDDLRSPAGASGCVGKSETTRPSANRKRPEAVRRTLAMEE